MELYQDIPRICTALAEWGACMTYIYLIKRDNFKMKIFWLISFAALSFQGSFLVLTKNLRTVFWIPCMLLAVLSMHLFIYKRTGLRKLSATYCSAKAFLLAEFAAALEWQIFTFFQSVGYGYLWLHILLVFFIYGLAFWGMVRLEKENLTGDYLKQLAPKELVAVLGIVISIFVFSNLSFIYEGFLFTSKVKKDIFSIRTLIDFVGMAILFAYQSKISEFVKDKELSALNMILRSQYDQYKNYRNSLELIQVKYHDLKHQIAGLRAETNEERRKEWLDAMEEEVSAFENVNKTGNPVLDTILAAKIFQCRNNKIQFTCVADGELLNFMHVMDICSIFGNALDNAIEYLVLIEREEKRLLHMSVSAKKNFVFIKVENYCEKAVEKNENQWIDTSKADKANHGFGLRSICRTAEKYGGSASFGKNNNWFELKILLPRG